MYTLIDSPITPYSTFNEVIEWIFNLEDMEKSKQVLDEIERCNQILVDISSKKSENLTEKS